MLRKSLLEECSGERLWEVCLAFSAVVLRKVVAERKRTFVGWRQGGPVAERLGTGVGGYGLRQRVESIEPLGLAHRVSLGRLVEERKRKAVGFAELSDRLDAKEVELEQRRRLVREREGAKLSEKTLRRLEGLEEGVRRSWVGSDGLRDVLLDGQAEKDDMLYKPLGQNAGNTPPSTQKTSNLLQTLSRTVEEQDKRVRRWQSMHEELLAKKHSRSKSSASAMQAVGLRFERHRDLGLRDAPAPTPSSAPRARSDSAVKMSARYDDILTSMREQLRHKRQASTPLSPGGQTGVNKAQNRPHASRHSSMHISTSSDTNTSNSTSAGAQDPRPYLLQTHNRSPSETAVPMRRPSHVSRRSSGIKPSHPSRSNSRSYTAPKVESQRGVIPLKSEVFSPVKSRVGSWQGSASGSLLGTPVETPMEEETGVDVEVEVEVDRESKRVSDEQHAVSHDSGVDMGTVKESPTSSLEDEKDAAVVEQTVSSSPTPLAATVTASPEASSDGKRSHSSSPVVSASAPVPAIRPSLAERTRMSMAFRSTEDVKDVKAEIETLPISVEEAANDEVDATTAEQKRRETLLERTRQSILVAPASASAVDTTSTKPKKKASHTRARSSIYPPNNNNDTHAINGRRSSIPNLLEEDGNEELDVNTTPKRKLRDITPREQLFSPDAEYSSVFKPRPKVKMSPVLSPFRNGDEEGEGGFGLGGEDGEGVLDR